MRMSGPDPFSVMSILKVRRYPGPLFPPAACWWARMIKESISCSD